MTLVVMLVATTSCSTGSAGSAGTGAAGSADAAGPHTSGQLTTVTVAAVPVADDAGLYIAKDNGYFRAAGLNVVIDPIVSSAVAASGLRDGTYDIAAGNSVSFIQEQVSGAVNLKVVAEGSLMQPGNQALYALPGSKISTIADLSGKRIGVNALNNIGTLLISIALKSHGVAPSDVTFVAIGKSFPGMYQALQARDIDVAWLPEPFGSIDEVTEGLQEVTDLDQGATANFPVAWYVSTKSWAKRDPAVLTRFLAALRQGQRLADQNRSVVEQAMERLAAPYTVPPKIAAVMSVESYPLNVAPGIDRTTVQQVADAMFEIGMLSDQFNVATMLTP